MLWPGTPTAKLLPAIPPGLPIREFQARLIEAIETESNALTLAAVRQGLDSPLSPQMREKLDALAAADQAERPA
jgi:hypothetical protein